MVNSVSFIGAGNVANHLAVALFEKGITINEICSKKGDSATELSKKVNARVVSDYQYFTNQNDIFIVAVNDNEIENVLTHFPFPQSLIAHTSGTFDAKNSFEHLTRKGVFYPLQTFSKNSKISLNDVPFLIETQQQNDEALLKTLAQLLSDKVAITNTIDRQYIHLAAVFACNFTNHFYAIASKILENQQLSLDILFPLISQTVEKIKTTHPIQAQTGPAIRKDSIVIQKHIDMLKNHPEWQKIYTFVSENIQRTT
jgi:predicted short-subunit dehydrogenase-like oxidoreductase (DUF2520 family)